MCPTNEIGLKSGIKWYHLDVCTVGYKSVQKFAFVATIVISESYLKS